MTMKKINAFEQGEAILKTLSNGAFLTTAADGKQNTMTIGWAAWALSGACRPSLLWCAKAVIPRS